MDRLEHAGSQEEDLLQRASLGFPRRPSRTLAIPPVTSSLFVPFVSFVVNNGHRETARSVALQGDAAGADDLLDTDRPQEVDDRVDLAATAGHLDGVMLG